LINEISTAPSALGGGWGLLNRIVAVQVCDARDDDKNYQSWETKN